ncbi:MAG: type II secretion system F family protein [Propionibacteriaceae bacterium]|jgi:tight adherence protein B|nr:type II secretion system F family protein [Propionibacteriaceae bacterium]
MPGWAALAASVAVWLWIPPAAKAGRLRQVVRYRQRAPAWRRRWPLALGAALAVTLAAAGRLAIGLSVGMVAVTVTSVAQASLRRRAARKRAALVMAGCRQLASLLRLGQMPVQALGVVADDNPLYAEPFAVAQIGGDLAAAFRRLGKVDGQEDLLRLGMAWEVSADTGASLTSTLDALVAAMGAAEETRHTVAAELSAPRATSRLLAGLPLVGIMLGFGMGGDPAAFLTNTPPGQIVGVIGVGLACAGTLWSERIANG